MKTTQYVRQERAIEASGKAGIRERIMYGHRLLADPDAFARRGESDQLRPNAVERLVAAATAHGYKLSQTEIFYRLKAARTYTTENEILQVLEEFDSWWSLIQAGFPAVKAADGEPADYRTKSERNNDRARALAAAPIPGQGELFPVRDYEPETTTLDDLQKYTREMAEITERFAERDRQRREYLDRLIAAAEGDMGMTWKEAHDRLGDGTEAGMDDNDEDPPLDPGDM